MELCLKEWGDTYLLKAQRSICWADNNQPLLHNNMSDPQVILGWFAAFVGAIGFGSFAVPIKGEAANSVDIDPLVMQSYKSLMCLWVHLPVLFITWYVHQHIFLIYLHFLCLHHIISYRSLTSWLVILLGQEVTFTWWGLVSGLFWVPGGAFNIFAIRNAGLAISQGIVASSIVMVSLLSLPIVARTCFFPHSF